MIIDCKEKFGDLCPYVHLFYTEDDCEMEVRHGKIIKCNHNENVSNKCSPQCCIFCKSPDPTCWQPKDGLYLKALMILEGLIKKSDNQHKLQNLTKR